MLWHKAWLETRWRFLIGAAVLLCSAIATVLMYPRVLELLSVVPSVDATTPIGREIRDKAALAGTYRGYIWSQWFRQNLPQLWMLFAALLGTGGLLAESARGSALFTLSMPVTRTRLVGIRAAAGLAELLVLALLSSLGVSIASPAIGEHYAVLDAVVHAACLFVGGAAVFCLAVLLSTLFTDIWRPMLIALATAGALSLYERAIRSALPYGFVGLVSAEPYFRIGQLPWTGLAIGAAASIALLVGACAVIERQEF